MRSIKQGGVKKYEIWEYRGRGGGFSDSSEDLPPWLQAKRDRWFGLQTHSSRTPRAYSANRYTIAKIHEFVVSDGLDFW